MGTKDSCEGSGCACGAQEWGSIPSRTSYLEIVAILKAHRSRHRRRLSVNEKHTMDGYLNTNEDANGQRINQYLYQKRRRSNPHIAGQVALIDSTLLSSRINAPRALFRGLRGPAVQQFTAAWAPGSTVVFPSYLSTSFMPLQALLYGVGGCILKFEIPNSLEVRAIYSSREDEIVLPRGLSWVIERVCDRLDVPLNVTVHPIHGSYRQATDTSVRMYVLSHPRLSRL